MRIEEEKSSLINDIMRTHLYDAADKVNKSGKDAVNAFAEGDEQGWYWWASRRFTKAEPFNSKQAQKYR